MILAIDVDYRESEAVVAGVVFDAWEDEIAAQIYYSVISEIKDYESGSFYLRELPCIIQLLEEYQLSPDVIVVDGFVYLGEESKPGLGQHLYNALDQNIPIVGVAKRPFKGTPPETEILRGQSAKPLYITSIGIDIETAKYSVLSMHGKHRIPTLLKRADRECRKVSQALLIDRGNSPLHK